MGYGQKRSELQAVATAKLEDAKLLFNFRRFSNAYYLAGYAVEIGLKACIALQVSAETIPPKAFIKKIFSHQFRKLIGLAGLTGDLKVEEDGNTEFATNWAVAFRWEPDIRYEAVDPTSAQELISAIAHQ